MRKTTVLLAGDNLLLRHDLRARLRLEQDFDVVGEAADGGQAVRLDKELRPEILVMDLEARSMNSWEATKRIHRQSPGCRMVVLSACGRVQFLSRMSDTGVYGYVLRETAYVDLPMAIREARSGNTYFSPAICRRLLDGDSPPRAFPTADHDVSRPRKASPGFFADRIVTSPSL